MRGFVSGVMSFVAPGGLVLLLAVGFFRPLGLPYWLHQPIAAMPYVVLTFGVISAWYLSSHRLFFSLLVLALAGGAVTLYPVVDQDPHSVGSKMFALSAFLLPLNLLALSILREQAASITRAMGGGLLVGLQLFLILWLCAPAQDELTTSLIQSPLAWLASEWTPVPEPALAAFLLAGALHVIRFALRRDPMEAGAFWTLVSALLAYHGTRFGWEPVSFFSAAGLIVVIGTFHALHRQAYRDELTGVAGRQAFEEVVRRVGPRYAFAVLELDQLKAYGSAHGRSVAEQVFKATARLVQRASRSATVYRVSGEELVLLFPGSTAVETLPALEAIRKAVEAASLVLRAHDRVRESRNPGTESRERDLPITISAGVAEGTEQSASLSAVQKAAYRALYEAKAAGGNVIRRGKTATQPLRRMSVSQTRAATSGEC